MAAIKTPKVSKLLTSNKKLLNRASNMFDDVINTADKATERSIKAIGGRWKSSSKKVQSKFKSALDAENLTDAIRVNNTEAPRKLSFISNATDSAPVKESKILNSKRATKDVNFVKPNIETKDLTDSSFAKIKLTKGTDINLKEANFKNIEAKGFRTNDDKFIPLSMSGKVSQVNDNGETIVNKLSTKQTPVSETMESVNQRQKERSVYNKSDLKKQIRQDKKVGDPNNFVYKMAAAGVGGGLVLSMSNKKGQQSNNQLYGQGGYQ